MYANTLVGGQATKGPFTSALPFGYDKLRGYNYEPDKAKQLLDEAGYKDTDGDSIREKMGKSCRLTHSQCGVRIRFRCGGRDAVSAEKRLALVWS